MLDCGILASDTVEILIEGKILLLLDGLDEVLDHDKHIISQEIVRFSEKYSKNILIVTCRTPAKTNTLRRFSDIEITPFTQRQIIAFTHKWFAIFTKNHLSNQDIGRQFLAQLDLPENLPLRRLVATPLFLHLACWVFHRQEQFPSKKAEFYKQCLYLLLNKWDTIRGIKRDEVYQGFSLPQKLKLISMLATKTFEKGVYFFEQSAIQDYISDFICNLPNAPSDPEELEYDSEIVLKEIELQHGIIVERVQGVFSFSCLTFQEYFIARKIALYEHLQSLSVLKSLVTHISDPRWREVFILTVTMLRSADRLISLMKQEIDNLVASDAYVQEFLTWASQTYLVTLQPTLSTTSFAFTQIQAQMSSPQQEMILQSWWQNDHLSLSERLETVASVHRSIESDWNFSLEQQQILERYYNANKLLIDCLNSNCQVTFALRREIETALLLF
ncbi:hypothetical protein NIES4102_21280 [Chondrocystis sp. NIES-4102]|nr:hypothetical protein NIES4102_21280 [Chondrocystis sp. NIES-4102]